MSIISRRLTASWRLCLLFLLLLPPLVSRTSVKAEEVVDLELILAIDCSGSVDAAEYALQMQGVAWALAQPSVLELIEASGERGIALAILQWSGSGEHYLALDWQLLRSAAQAKALAARIGTIPRRFAGGDTAIGSAISHASGLFAENGFNGFRRVVDLSGDGGAGRGQTTAAFIAQHARDIAMSRSVVVNGLAILNEDPELDVFYRENIITGAGAFVMTAKDYDDFANAMLKKLLREISDKRLAGDSATPRAEQLSQSHELVPGSSTDGKLMILQGMRRGGEDER